jgi:hypothetical protein
MGDWSGSIPRPHPNKAEVSGASSRWKAIVVRQSAKEFVFCYTAVFFLLTTPLMDDHQSGNFFLGFDQISNHSMGAFNEIERLLCGRLQHRPLDPICVCERYTDALWNAAVPVFSSGL